jgi:hypothetical protein
MPAAPDVVTHVLLDVIGPLGPEPVPAELRYDAQDPYAITMVFRREDREVTWVFGRDLLMRGLHEQTGDGDVQVFPSVGADGRAVVLLELASPAGHALVQAPARDVLTFLACTTRLVWPGEESDHLRVDDAITALLVRG